MTQSQIIRDNRNNGSVADFLKEIIKDNSKVSIVSAYFTIYAYNALKDKLDNIQSMRFLFGEPTFVKGLNGDKNPKVYEIEDSKLEIKTENQLQQKKIAKDCAEWIRNKVEVKSMVKSNFLHGKLYHVDEDGRHSSAISGSSNFTTKGLGLSENSNMELNLIVDSDTQRQQLLDWFNELWNNSEWVKDVKEDVLKYIEQLYSENAPDFIYYKTLYEIFHEYLDDQKNNSLLYVEQTGFFESEVCFWPTEDLDGYINLKNRVEARMALVDLTATAEDNVLQNPELKDLIDEDLKYRTKQLKRLKEEVIDIEDLEYGITLTDFSLDDFRIDLANYIEENRGKLEKAPLGMYSVVPCPSNAFFATNKLTLFNQAEKDIIKPGVVFCLTQKIENKDGQTVNPLYPYFLVYIREDGTVRYNFTNSKKILEILQLICRNEKEAYNELCDLFNCETKDGKDMKVYENLLSKAFDEVVRMFKKREALRLTQNRDAVIVKKANNLRDFNLVTWFVIK